MTTLTPKTTDYRDQIQRCVQTMALGCVEDVRPFLANGMAVEQVKLFTDGNLEKRFEKVRDQVELLKAAFDNLDDLVHEFILEVPLAAYDERRPVWHVARVRRHGKLQPAVCRPKLP